MAAKKILESAVKKDVKKLLAAFGANQFWPVQSGYGAPALDCIICHKGWFLSVETKAPGKKLSARQEMTKRGIEEAGGTVFVVGEQLLKHPDKIIIGAKEYAFKFSGMLELAKWLSRKL